MYSDDDDQSTEVASQDEHDKKLEELWSRKDRRRSSTLKRFFEDLLDLRENPKIISLLRKYGECVIFALCKFASSHIYFAPG